MEEIKPQDTSFEVVKMSEDIGELATALAKAQANIDAVKKDEQGYGYNYASLASSIEVSKKPLNDNGLSVSQWVGRCKGQISITTMILHSSGQYLMGTGTMDRVDMKGVNTAQQDGATISYLRRYCLQAALNMASEDNDASSKGTQSSSKKSSTSSSKSNSSTEQTETKTASRRSGFGGMRKG